MIEGKDTLPFPVPEGRFSSAGSYFAPGIDSNANIAGSVISNGVAVDEGAKIEDSLLMSGCEVGSNVIIQHSVLGRHVKVGEGAVIRHAVIGDDVVIEPNGSVIEARIPSNA